MKELLAEVEGLAGVENDLFRKDFLLTWDTSDAGIEVVRRTARLLQHLYQNEISTRVFDTGLGLSIFRDNSTRTRYAFRSGCNLLGLGAEELNEEHSQIAHGETVRETATMISFLSEVVGIRDDKFLGEGHTYMKAFGEALEDSYKQGALEQRTTVLNLQCDLDHPTQTMSDLRHLEESFGGLENLKGKKIAMTWAYSPSYGKPLSVAQGIITLMTRFGMDVVLAHPEGYDLVDDTVAVAHKHAAKSGGSFSVTNDMSEAFDGAHIVYPKSWAPAAVMRERTKLLRAGEKGRLDALEQEALAQNAKHTDWEANEAMMKKTADGDALYMHCLPADITGVSCEKGEVTDAVFEKYRIRTYREAAHKPFVIAAMALATRFEKPAELLRQVVERARPRRGA